MPASRFLLPICVALAGVGHALAAPANTAPVDAAFVLTLGRLPSNEERAAALKADGDIVARIQALRQRLSSDLVLDHDAATRAYEDAFGQVPTAADLAGGKPATSYTDAVAGHLQWLAAHPDAYVEVIERVYPLVISRKVYPEEIAYWKKQPPLPFVLLVGCVENWARRNQPGLMVTTGTPTMSVNSEFLTTVPLGPAEAHAAAEAFKLPIDTAPESSRSQPHHLVAAGGASVATDGGMYFAVAGSPSLVH